MFGTKAELKEHAKERIADLKNRGYKNAGLYDPQGVGGTHVMYVLHHADQPSIYANLPEDPHISPIVKTWKGISKYFGLGAIAAAILGAAAHGIFIGRTRVTKHDEERAEKTLEDIDHDA